MIYKYNRISEAGLRLIKDWKKNAQNFRKLSDSSICSYSRDIKFFLSFIENYPKHYQWHISFEDWDGMINELENIYNRERTRKDERGDQ